MIYQNLMISNVCLFFFQCSDFSNKILKAPPISLPGLNILYSLQDDGVNCCVSVVYDGSIWIETMRNPPCSNSSALGDMYNFLV